MNQFPSTDRNYDNKFIVQQFELQQDNLLGAFHPAEGGEYSF